MFDLLLLTWLLLPLVMMGLWWRAVSRHRQRARAGGQAIGRWRCSAELWRVMWHGSAERSAAPAAAPAPAPEPTPTPEPEAATAPAPEPEAAAAVEAEAEAARLEKIRAFQEGSRRGQEAWRSTPPPAPTPPRRTSKTPRATTKALTKIRSQVVQFEYMDAKGDFSSRKVRVDTVGQWQFEGYCYTRHERRTFRYDGVIGCVTIHSTGEIVTPEKLERELLAL